MIKIEKIEKGYLRCQSCNDDSPLDNISIGLNLNNTSSFRLCSDCLSFFSKTIDKVKIEELQEQNKIMRKALEFYAENRNWEQRESGSVELSVIDPVDHFQYVDKWGDLCWIGGKRAREALARAGE